MDINQRIDYLVGLYGVEQVNKGLSDLEKGFKKTETSAQVLAKQLRQGTYANQQFLRVVQDAPYFFSSYQMGFMSISNNLPMLAEGFQNARNSGLSFGQALKTTLLGFNPWMTAINLAISGFLAWSLYSQNAKKETEELKKELDLTAQAAKNLLNIDNPFSRLKIDVKPEDVPQAIKTIENLLEKTKMGIAFEKDYVKFAYTSKLTQVEAHKDRLKELEKEKTNLEESLKVFQEYNTKLETNKSIVDSLTQAGFKFIEENNKTTKSIQEQTEAWQSWAEIQEDIARAEYWRSKNPSLAPPRLPDTIDMSFKELFGDLPTGEAKFNILTELDIRNNNKEFAIIADSFGSALNTAGQNAFRSIFGEANDLLSLFLQNIATGFLSLAAQNVAGSLLGFLTGTPLGFLAGSPKTSGGGNQTLIVQIGDRQIVTKNNIASTTRRLIRVGEF